MRQAFDVSHYWLVALSLTCSLAEHITSARETQAVTLDSLAARVAYLIDRFHGGSARAASAFAGVPQRTLLNIATGAVAHPRVDALERIARSHEPAGVTMDWLVSGRGSPPRVAVEVAGQTITDPGAVSTNLAFANALRAAGVSETSPLHDAITKTTWLAASVAFNAAGLYVDATGARIGSATAESPQTRALLDAAGTASTAVTDGWTTALHAIAKAYGPDLTSRALFELLPEFACHESFLDWLEVKGHFSRARIVDWYQQYLAESARMRALIEIGALSDLDLTYKTSAQMAEMGTAEAKPEASPPPVRQRSAKKKRTR